MHRSGKIVELVGFDMEDGALFFFEEYDETGDSLSGKFIRDERSSVMLCPLDVWMHRYRNYEMPAHKDLESGKPRGHRQTGTVTRCG